MASTAYCPGVVSLQELIDQSGSGVDLGGIVVPVCSTQWEVAQYTPPFDVSQLDPTLMGQAFGAGFMLIASVLVVTIGIRALVNLVKTI